MPLRKLGADLDQAAGDDEGTRVPPVPETSRPNSLVRRNWARLWRSIDAWLPGEDLASLATWAMLMLLTSLLLMFVVREIRDGALTGCPAYDGVTHRQAADALCPTR